MFDGRARDLACRSWAGIVGSAGRCGGGLLFGGWVQVVCGTYREED